MPRCARSCAPPSRAGIRGTTINFAIPADFVKQLLAGRVLEGKFSEPYIKDGQPVLPVKYMCLDPFNRIKEVKVEVWTGNAGPERPFALETPTPRPGDGPRQTHTISYNNAVAQGEVPLPALGPGQVVWLQPVLVHGVGNSQWGPGLASEADLIALERKPANLLLNQTAHKLRTAHLKLSMGNTLIRGKEKQTSADRAELDFLEAIYAVPKGIAAKLSFGPPVVSYEEDGRKLPMDPAVPDLLRRIPPTFVINPANRMMERGAINLSPKLHPKIREYTNDYFNEICNAYEATTLVMPNRELQPLETWDAVVTMLMKQERKVEPADLVLACTYEGTRSRKGRAEALITVVGQVKGRGANQNKMDGKVNGRFAFDLGDGYISLAKVSIVSEADILGGALQLTNAFEMDLSRAPGNPLNLEVPKQGEQPKELPPIKGTVVFQIPNGVLNNADSFDPDPKHKGSRAKLIQVKLQKDKTYAIQLNSNQFDPYLRLMDPKGNTIAIDDDSGGNLNARIDIKAPVTGVYGIVVTTFDRKIGDFQLIVTQLQP